MGTTSSQSGYPTPSTPSDVKCTARRLRGLSLQWKLQRAETCEVEVAGALSWAAASFEAGNEPRKVTDDHWQAIVEGLECKTPYSFRIRGKNAAIAGEWAEASFTTSSTPLEPTSLQCMSRTPTQLALEWKVADPGGAEVKRCEIEISGLLGWATAVWAKGGEPARIQKTGTRWQATVGELNGSTSYNIRIRGCNAAGGGEWASFAAATSDAPGSTSLKCKSRRPDKLCLEWALPDPEGAPLTACEVEIANAASMLQSPYAASVTEAPKRLHLDYWQVIIKELQGNLDYFVRVRGVNAVGVGPWFSETFRTSDAPCEPSAFKCVGRRPEYVALEWKIEDPVGADVTRCEVEVSGNFSWSPAVYDDGAPIRVRANRWQVIVAGLMPDTTYEMRVRGCNAVGEGPWIRQEFQTSARPQVPKDFECSQRSPKKLALTWKVPAAEGAPLTGCAVQVMGNLSWQSAEVESPASHDEVKQQWSATVIGLEPATAYSIRVRGLNVAGEGDWLQKEFKTSDFPKAPHSVNCWPGRLPGTMRMTWQADDPEGAEVLSCAVMVCTGVFWGRAAHSEPVVKTGNTWHTTLADLNVETQFSVSVSASNAIGSSDWSKPWSQNPPEKPFDFRWELHRFGFNAQWQVADMDAAPVTSCAIKVTPKASVLAARPTWTQPEQGEGFLWSSTITDVTAGALYTVEVSGCNIAGQGQPWVQEVAMPEKPPAPSNIMCVRPMRQQLRLEWWFMKTVGQGNVLGGAASPPMSPPDSPPMSPPSSPLRNESRFSEASKWRHAHVAVCELQQFIDGSWQEPALSEGCAPKKVKGCWQAKIDSLSPGTLYEFRVRGCNAVGIGEWKQCQFQTSF